MMYPTRGDLNWGQMRGVIWNQGVYTLGFCITYCYDADCVAVKCRGVSSRRRCRCRSWFICSTLYSHAVTRTTAAPAAALEASTRRYRVCASDDSYPQPSTTVVVVWLVKSIADSWQKSVPFVVVVNCGCSTWNAV